MTKNSLLDQHLDPPEVFRRAIRSLYPRLTPEEWDSLSSVVKIRKLPAKSYFLRAAE
ncbi:MAG: hypothetical protein AAFW73_03685 [Bacteroidota bacterium]